MAVGARAHESSLSKSAAKATPDVLRPIPVRLHRLLEPHKKHGKLTLRIEKLPSRARFSSGTLTGDRAWSLTREELDGLNYLLPEGVDENHSWSVRIIGLERGDTLSVIEVSVAQVRGEVSDEAPVAVDETAIVALREELARMKSSLGEREGQLVEARQALEHIPAAGGPDPEALRAAWKAEEAQRFAAAEAKWQEASANLESGRAASRAEAAEHFKIAEARWMETIAKQAREAQGQLEAANRRWQQEAETALAKAEQDWKAGEAARVAALQTQWQQKSDRALSELRAEAGKSKVHGNDAELKELANSVALWQAKVSERDETLARTGKALEAERAGRQHDAQEAHNALLLAERDKNSGEASKLAEAETFWRSQAAQQVNQATRRAEAAESVLADLRIRSADNTRLENEMSTLRATLAAREVELAQTRAGGALQHHSVQEMPPAAPIAKVEVEDKATAGFIRQALLVGVLAAGAVWLLPEITALLFSLSPQSASAVVQAPVELAPPPAQAEQIFLPTAVVRKTSRLRSAPALSANSLLRVERGVEVSVLEQRETWTRIRMNHKTRTAEGWVESSTLDMPER